MLFTNISEGDVVTMKTISGEEIVARYVDENEKAYQVKKPMTLVHTGSGMGLMPYILTIHNDMNVDIYKHGLSIAPIKSDMNMASQYIENTTGIKLAN